MREKMTLQKICCCVCFLIVLGTSCNCGTVELVNGTKSNGEVKSHETLYYLDANKPSIVQPIETKKGESLEDYKFVQVEVTEVVNPKRHPLSFEVRYQSKNNVKTYLGSFSLYPADNPGKFIVATQGKVKDEGAIILTLVTPDKIDPADTVKVTVKKIKFLKG